MSSAILRRQLLSLGLRRMGSLSAPYTNGVSRSMSTRSLTTLKRWSCSNKDLPSIDKIKHIHVYDFDNTLFASPVPNRQLWNGSTIGLLQNQDTFTTGGWWHDSSFLASTGQGLEKEEPKAWDGWWNESVVNLVELTMEQRDALNVLLTGRNEAKFAELVQRILKSKKLEFDMICLRPEAGPSNQKFTSTMQFKQAFLEDLVCTYRDATEIRIYEDRPRHVTTFRDYMVSLNDRHAATVPPPRNAINCEVIEVAENATILDPVTEAAEVQRMINAHNVAFRDGALPRGAKPWELKRTVFYTGYLIAPADTTKLLRLANLPTTESHHNEIRTLANNIMITPRPCPAELLNKVGGIGKKLRWRVVAIGSFEDKIWGAKVEPVPSTEPYHCENHPPTIVLGLKRTAKPWDIARIKNWQPLSEDKSFEIDTTVGEKVLLRVEEERPADEALPNDTNVGFKRPRPQDSDFPPLGQAPNSQPTTSHQPVTNGQQQNRSYHQQRNRPPNYSNAGGQRGSGASQRGRGAGNVGVRGAPSGPRNSNNPSGRGGQGGGANPRGRGRGGFGRPYRSLDDEANQAGKAKGVGYGYDGANDGDGLTY